MAVRMRAINDPEGPRFESSPESSPDLKKSRKRSKKQLDGHSAIETPVKRLKTTNDPGTQPDEKPVSKRRTKKANKKAKKPPQKSEG